VHVGITGGSGYLGTALTPELRAHGHQVVPFVRSPGTDPEERLWDGHQLPPDLLHDLDAVVHLSGAGVGDKRWTRAYREEIRSSRVDTTQAVARAVAQAGTPVLLAANAIGWYGDRGDAVLDETSEPGTGFLASVCREWEQATAPARGHTRLAVLHTGVVIGPDDALLRKQVPFVKAFLGAPLGNGHQWLTWIALTDWTAAVRHVLARELEGRVNLTSPNPVTNADFTKALGRALHRPILPIGIPGFAVRAVVGGFAEEALGSQRVMPRVLQQSGFAFQLPEIAGALDAALG
jgi:uncharacterized protein (TIGR01777 family)